LAGRSVDRRKRRRQVVTGVQASKGRETSRERGGRESVFFRLKGESFYPIHKIKTNHTAGEKGGGKEDTLIITSNFHNA